MSKKDTQTKPEPARQPAAAALPASWPNRVTRGQAADRLGTSVASIRRLEGKTLHPIEADGTWCFDPDEIAALGSERDKTPARREKRSDGELAAEAFELFNGGAGFREAVVKLREPPKIIRALYQEWRDDGDLWVPRKVLREIRRTISSKFAELRPVRIRTVGELKELFDAVMDEVAYDREVLARRSAKIRNLESDNRALRAKPEKARAEIRKAPPPIPCSPPPAPPR